MNNRAWSLLQIKQVNDELRVVEGIATTPTVDRVGDIVDPMGAVFRGPVKLHLYHKHDLPVGLVTFGKPTKAGIPFSASIPDVREEGTVRERVNEAWHSVKYKLLDAVSIGFSILEDGVEVKADGGYHFKRWEMLELSLVGVPANPDAVVTAFKSADPSKIRSALGVDPGQTFWTPPGPVKLIKRAPTALPSGAVRLNTKSSS